jgi:BlaI family penicillinase repressor
MTHSERLPMSDAERDVLRVLWDHGPQPVREVLRLIADQGQEWARTTVITLLQRLEKKGYVDSDRSQNAFVFRPIVSRQEEMHARMVDLAGELCEGDAMPLVLAFAERHKFSADEIERFRKMIDDLQPKRRKRGSK